MCDHLNQATKIYSLRISFKLFSLWIKSLSVTIEVKASKHYFLLVMFIMLHKVFLSFESIFG